MKKLPVPRASSTVKGAKNFPTHPVEGSNELSSLYSFSANSRMKALLPSAKDQFTLQEVLSELKKQIKDRELYDKNNPAIILCDNKLEDMLNVNSAHMRQIRNLVLSQLTKVDIHSDNGSPPKNGFGDTETSKDLIQTPAQPVPTHIDAPTAAGLELNQKSMKPLEDSARYYLKQDLFDVFLKADLLVEKDIKNEFSWIEVATLVSKYILSRKETLLDVRNIEVARVEGDPLEEVFGVKAFHRSQVTYLVKKHLENAPKRMPKKRHNSTVSQSGEPPSNKEDVGSRAGAPAKPDDQKLTSACVSYAAGKAIADGFENKIWRKIEGFNVDQKLVTVALLNKFGDVESKCGHELDGKEIILINDKDDQQIKLQLAVERIQNPEDIKKIHVHILIYEIEPAKFHCVYVESMDEEKFHCINSHGQNKDPLPEIERNRRGNELYSIDLKVVNLPGKKDPKWDEWDAEQIMNSPGSEAIPESYEEAWDKM